MVEVDAMLDWLNNSCAKYEFTGDGMELVTFLNESDAVPFKLKFQI